VLPAVICKRQYQSEFSTGLIVAAFCAEGGSTLSVRGLRPYWMAATEAVANDVTLQDNVAILTGPNMGGKSTFLRALVAVALLANCGLPIPARAGASVPEVRRRVNGVALVLVVHMILGHSATDRHLQKNRHCVAQQLFTLQCYIKRVAIGSSSRRFYSSTCVGVQYGSFMFRNFRGDSPMEQRSGFALEAMEMQIVLSRGRALPAPPTQPREFVCIDEFGKGTEDEHATALCAAVIRQLDQVCTCAHESMRWNSL
jgi:MutS domain V